MSAATGARAAKDAMAAVMDDARAAKDATIAEVLSPGATVRRASRVPRVPARKAVPKGSARRQARVRTDRVRIAEMAIASPLAATWTSSGASRVRRVSPASRARHARRVTAPRKAPNSAATRVRNSPASSRKNAAAAGDVAVVGIAENAVTVRPVMARRLRRRRPIPRSSPPA